MTNDALTDYTAQLLCVAVCAEARRPLLLTGSPGKGKTRMLERYAQKRGRALEIVIGSIREPSDYAGIPIPTDGDVIYAPPRWVKNAMNAGVDVFHDEMNGASPATANAMLRGVLDRQLGDSSLHDDVWQFAAQNPPGQAAGAWELSPAMANRWVHLNWDEGATAAVMAIGFRNGWPDVPDVEFDTAALPAARSQMDAKISVFVERVHSEYAHHVPENPAEAATAWPSWRTWEYVADLCSYLDVSNISDGLRQLVRNRLVIGCIGPAAAGAFLAWEERQDLPDPEELLADPRNWTPPTDLDRLYPIAASVLGALSNNTTSARWNAAGDVLARICESGKEDIGASFGREWAMMRPNDPDATGTDYTQTQLEPILQRIGVRISRTVTPQ